MTNDISQRRDSILDSLKDSKNLSATEKDYFTALIVEAAENTNGRTETEKIQGMSQSIFHLTSMFIIDKLDSNNNAIATVANCIKECKWQITICLGIIALAFIFRPEIATLITNVIK